MHPMTPRISNEQRLREAREGARSDQEEAQHEEAASRAQYIANTPLREARKRKEHEEEVREEQEEIAKENKEAEEEAQREAQQEAAEIAAEGAE